jgi:DNA-binding response OmpR family regulator
MSQHPPGQTQRVVVIESDPALAQLIDDLLTADGCTVTHVASPDAAWQQLPRALPALIVLGLDLAGAKAAWTFLNQLRAKPQTAWLPILFAVADERLADEQGALLRAEGYALIEIPFDVDDFLAQARALLRAGRRAPTASGGETELPPTVSL